MLSPVLKLLSKYGLAMANFENYSLKMVHWIHLKSSLNAPAFASLYVKTNILPMIIYLKIGQSASTFLFPS